jgi:hypothetical protein
MANKNIRVNIGALRRKFKTSFDVVNKAVFDEINATSLNIVGDMKRDAPVNLGQLRNQIIAEPKKVELQVSIKSRANYSAFVEFGTKKKAVIPSGLERVAAKFKGIKGNGDAVEAIAFWAKRVGIPEEKRGAVIYSILRNGIKPKPFFFGNFQKGINKYESRLTARIKKVLSKTR